MTKPIPEADITSPRPPTEGEGDVEGKGVTTKGEGVIEGEMTTTITLDLAGLDRLRHAVARALAATTQYKV